MIDYHIHYHRHGESGEYELERLEEIVAFARNRGIVEVGLSEHVFRFVEFLEVVGGWWNDTDDPKWLKEHCERYFVQHATQSVRAYLDTIVRAQEAGLPVRAGVELDYYPGRMGEVGEFVGSLELDFVLGSVHWIGAWGFDNEEVLDEWERRNPDRVYEKYFELLLDLAASGLVQVLAHPDLPKKFGHAPVAYDLAGAYERTVRACKKWGVGLEVSSAGWRMPANEQYPSKDFLEKAISEAIRVTTGSDAHVPELVGDRLDEVYDLLRGLGYRAVYGYRRRDPCRIVIAFGSSFGDPVENDDERTSFEGNSF